MRLIPIIFLVLLLSMGVVSAQTITYTCPSGVGIQNLVIASDSPTAASITLQLQDSSTVVGSWSYQPKYIFGVQVGTTAGISMDGVSKSFDFITPGKLYTSAYTYENRTQVVDDQIVMGTNGRLVLAAGQTSAYNNIAIGKAISSPIVAFTIVSDSDVTYTKTEKSLEELGHRLQGSGAADILTMANETFWSAYDFLTNLAYWLRFFFIDNLGLIIALYLSVTMVFAARAARGHPDKFLSKFIGNQVKLINFMLDLWRMLLESIGTIRGWFRI